MKLLDSRLAVLICLDQIPWVALGSHSLTLCVKWGWEVITFCINLCGTGSAYGDAGLLSSVLSYSDCSGQILGNTSSFTQNVRVCPDKFSLQPSNWDPFLPIPFHPVTVSLVATVMWLPDNERASGQWHLGLLCHVPLVQWYQALILQHNMLVISWKVSARWF